MATAEKSVVPASTENRSALTVVEANELARCEHIIKEGRKTFIEVANALRTINEKKLYRATHETFADYVKDKWDRSRQWAYQMIEASEVVETVSTLADTGPAVERQARTLAALPKDEQGAAWQEAKEMAKEQGLGAPTTKHVTAAVEKRLPRKEVEIQMLTEATKAELERRAQEPEPEPDIAAELQHAHAEIATLKAQVEALAREDQGKELRAQMAKYAQLDARLQSVLQEKSKIAGTLEYFEKLCKNLQRIVGVARPSELVGAVQKLKDAAK